MFYSETNSYPFIFLRNWNISVFSQQDKEILSFEAYSYLGLYLKEMFMEQRDISLYHCEGNKDICLTYQWDKENFCLRV